MYRSLTGRRRPGPPCSPGAQHLERELAVGRVVIDEEDAQRILAGCFADGNSSALIALGGLQGCARQDRHEGVEQRRSLDRLGQGDAISTASISLFCWSEMGTIELRST